MNTLNDKTTSYVYVRQGTTLHAPLLAEVGGYVSVDEGATLNAPLLAEVGGDVSVSKGATLNAPLLAEVYREIAHDEYSALFRSTSGRYRAGCRGPWTAEQALEHWGPRSDDRAVLFCEAIRKAEGLV